MKRLGSRGIVAAVVALTGVAGAPQPSALGDPPDPLVVLWVIDGLEPSVVSAATMPALTGLASDPAATTHVWRRTQAAMIAETYPNHVTMATGAWGDTSGVPGNTIWDGSRFVDPEPGDVRVETLFDRVEDERPGLRTSLVAGDPDVAAILAHEPVDTVWDPLTAPLRLPVVDYPLDGEVVNEAVARVKAGDDFVFMNTQMVDTFGHFSGPAGELTRVAMTEVDRQVARLVAHLRSAGRWGNTVLFVVSDHGMALTPQKTSLTVWLWLHGVFDWQVVAAGSVAQAAKPGATPGEARSVRRLLACAPGVDAAYATGGQLARARPGWHLDDPRVGDVVVVAAPGWSFAELFDLTPGTHGHPAARRNWMMVTGGHPRLRAGDDVRHVARQVDLAPTIASLLRVAPPADSQGRVLTEAVAPTP